LAACVKILIRPCFRLYMVMDITDKDDVHIIKDLCGSVVILFRGKLHIGDF